MTFSRTCASEVSATGGEQKSVDSQRLFSDREVLAGEGQRVAVEVDEDFHRVRSGRQVERLRELDVRGVVDVDLLFAKATAFWPAKT